VFSHSNTYINIPNFSLVILGNHAIISFIFVTLSPCNTCIAFPKFSLVFFANYARPTSIIVKLHFAALASCNTQMVFPNSSLGFLVHYATLGLKMSIVVLTNYVIFVYLHVFPTQNLFIHEYACVMFDIMVLTCSIALWNQGPLEIGLDQQMLVFAWPLK